MTPAASIRRPGRFFFFVTKCAHRAVCGKIGWKKLTQEEREGEKVGANIEVCGRAVKGGLTDAAKIRELAKGVRRAYRYVVPSL